MTVPDLDKRVNDALARFCAVVPGVSKAQAKFIVSNVLIDALSELFDGSAWLAPWEADESMLRAGTRYTDRITETHIEPRVWRQMRDAHLAKTEGR